MTRRRVGRGRSPPRSGGFHEQLCELYLLTLDELEKAYMQAVSVTSLEITRQLTGDTSLEVSSLNFTVTLIKDTECECSPRLPSHFYTNCEVTKRRISSLARDRVRHGGGGRACGGGRH